MAQGPENRMLSRLKPGLEKSTPCFIEKTNNPFRRGIPDWYVEGERGWSGWVEAKFWSIQRIPTDMDIAPIVQGKLSEHQKKWLRRAHNNQQSIAVLCGFPDTNKYIFAQDDQIFEDPVPTLPVLSLAQFRTAFKAWLYGYEMETHL